MWSFLSGKEDEDEGLIHRSITSEEVREVLEADDGDNIPAAPLSQDAYGVAILCLVQGFDAMLGTHVGNSTKFQGIAAVAFGLFLLVLNGSIQLFLLIYTYQYVCDAAVRTMRSIYDEFHEDIFGPTGEFLHPAWHEWDEMKRRVICQFPFSQTSFFFCILFLWSLVIGGEIRGCIRWVKDLHALPNSEEGPNMTVKGDTCYIVSSRRQVRWIVYGAAVLPKFAIAGVVWWIGCRWLASTPAFADLILNSCALSFILTVDETIYEALVPEKVRMQVESTQVFSMRLSSSKLSEQWKEIPVMTYLSTLLHLSIAVLLTWLYIFKFQTVLPYHWDVVEHCRNDDY